MTQELLDMTESALHILLDISEQVPALPDAEGSIYLLMLMTAKDRLDRAEVESDLLKKIDLNMSGAAVLIKSLQFASPWIPAEVKQNSLASLVEVAVTATYIRKALEA